MNLSGLISEGAAVELQTLSEDRELSGCLVGRTDAGHRQFMQLLKSDSRYGVNTGYMFMTTVISGEQLTAELG